MCFSFFFYAILLPFDHYYGVLLLLFLVVTVILGLQCGLYVCNGVGWRTVVQQRHSRALEVMIPGVGTVMGCHSCAEFREYCFPVYGDG